MSKFLIQEKESWRDLIFEVDILNEIDWIKIDISGIAEKTLADKESKEQELILGLSKEEKEFVAGNRQTGNKRNTGNRRSIFSKANFRDCA